LIGRIEGKRPLGRPRYMPEDKIKMDVRDIGWGGIDWIDLPEYRNHWKALVAMVMNLWVP
jgi:hypothetical protein